MRWLGVAAVALPALAYSVATWWVGKQIEPQLRHGHALLSEQWGLPVELLQYQRGWFSSTAVSQIRLGNHYRSPVVTWQHRIAHGPLPALRALGWMTTQSAMTIAPQAPTDASSALDDAAPMHLRSALHFDRSVQVALSGRAFDLTDAEEGQWRILPLEWAGQFGRDMRTLTTQVEWEGLTWSDPAGAALTVGAVRASDDYHLPDDRAVTYEGRSRYTVAQLDVKDVFPSSTPMADRKPYTMHAAPLTLGLDATRQGDFLDWVGTFSAKSLLLDEQDKGPAQWAMSLRQMHIQTLEGVLPMLPAWLDGLGGAINQGAMPLAAQQATQTAIASLFNQGLRVQLDRLSFYTPEGEVVLDAQWDAQTLSGSDLAFLPMSLASKVNASVHFRAPEAAIEQWRGAHTVALYLEQGLLKRQGDEVLSTLQYQRGLSTINGLPVDPAGLGQLLE